MVIIFIVSIALILIYRIKNIVNMLKNPLVLKGLLYHFVFCMIFSLINVPKVSSNYDFWDEERKIKQEVTVEFLKEKLSGRGIETRYFESPAARNKYITYDDNQEINRIVDKKLQELRDSVKELPSFVYDILELIRNVVIAFWICLSFVFEPMRKAILFFLAIVSFGLFLFNPGRDGTEPSINENADTSYAFVDPHYVNSYEMQNGTQVDGYWRDGDGDTSNNLTLEEGGGYWRSDPDGNPNNNLKS